MDVQIPGYTTIRPIGKGGMAVVYLAYQHSLERHVALKVLTPALAGNPDFCERFLREARIGASLSHRNIVPVFDVGHYLLHRYMAMEYLPEGDLAQRVAGGCDTGTILRILYDVACALEYAHSKSFIHRDIKPANILFREDQTAVLTDFGIAMDLKSAAVAGTGDRIIAGSPCYMSPEQARAGGLDVRSDIYSLGVVMYEALARRPLLEPSATVADAVRHSADPVPRLPGELYWLQPLLDRMLAKNPAERFATMREVVQTLELCLKIPESLLALQRRPAAEPAPTVSPLPELRFSPADARSARAVTGTAEEPRLSSSAPTLIDKSDEELELEFALASCPPPISSFATHRKSRRHRPWSGMLVLLLVLAAVPVGWHFWPALSGSVAPSLVDLPLAEDQPDYSRVTESPALPMPEADPVPDAAVEMHTMAVAMPEPETAVEPLPVPSNSAQDTAGLTPAAADTEKPEASPEPDPVAVLLQQADAALAARQAVSDVDTAYEKYREVLALDPQNKPAHQGLWAVASRYLELASKALNEDRLEQAQEYVDQASSIASRHRLGYQITQRIDDMQYTIRRIRYLEG